MSVGVAAETEVLAPLGLSVGRLEVIGKLEDCVQDLAGEFAERKGDGSGQYSGLYVLQPGVQQPRAPAFRIQRPAPGAGQTLGPASPSVCPGSPARIDIGRGTARSSRHWLGNRLSRVAAVTLRLGLGALE